MSADQTPVRRPAAITQRDGSKLANSNCRMAAISTGLEYDSGKKSTGGKMRTYTADQAGGTDSGDAREAWAKGYREVLDVQDGKTWADVLVDLRRGRLVHLDVWHATVGGPCLSGSGGYGHTLAVLPDCKGNAWLVADPWCRPGRWSRVAESKLKAGAEKWGNQVYGTARQITGGAPPTRELLREIILELMSRWLPGRPGPAALPDMETGGPPRVLYTATVAQALKPPDPIPPPVGDDMGIALNLNVTKDADPFDALGTARLTAAGVRRVKDDVAVSLAVGTDLGIVQVGTRVTDGVAIVALNHLGELHVTPRANVTFTPLASPDCPDPEPCPDCPDPGPLVSAAVAARDETWEGRIRGGEAWPTIETPD